MKLKTQKIFVGILYGGDSPEGQVSIYTAKSVSESLASKGFKVVNIDINDPQFLVKIISVDLIFNCLHGEIGEDGKIQGLFEVLRKPYTGSGVFASALCRDKIKFKSYIKSKGFLTPNYIEIKESSNLNQIKKIPFPAVIKPRQSGGGIGIKKVNSFTEVKSILKEKDNFRDYFIEEFITGNILTVATLESNKKVICSPVIQIILPAGKDIYDFDTKINSKATFSIFYDESSEKIIRTARSLHMATGCAGFSRIDFILNSKGIYVLEINTIPSLFEGSSYRFAMEKNNINFDELCFFILTNGLQKKKAYEPLTAPYVVPSDIIPFG